MEVGTGRVLSTRAPGWAWTWQSLQRFLGWAESRGELQPDTWFPHDWRVAHRGGLRLKVCRTVKTPLLRCEK